MLKQVVTEYIHFHLLEECLFWL